MMMIIGCKCWKCVFAIAISVAVVRCHADRVDPNLCQFYVQVTNLWATGGQDRARDLANERIAKCPQDLVAWTVRTSWDLSYGDGASAKESVRQFNEIAKKSNSPSFVLLRDSLLRPTLMVLEAKASQRKTVVAGPRPKGAVMELNECLRALDADGLFGNKHTYSMACPGLPRGVNVNDLKVFAEANRKKASSGAVISREIEEAIPKYAIGGMHCPKCNEERVSTWCRTQRCIVRPWPNGESYEWKVRQQFNCQKHGNFGRECKTQYVEGIPEGPCAPIREIDVPITDVGM